MTNLYLPESYYRIYTGIVRVLLSVLFTPKIGGFTIIREFFERVKNNAFSMTVCTMLSEMFFCGVEIHEKRFRDRTIHKHIHVYIVTVFFLFLLIYCYRATYLQSYDAVLQSSRGSTKKKTSFNLCITLKKR